MNMRVRSTYLVYSNSSKPKDSLTPLYEMENGDFFMTHVNRYGNDSVQEISIEPIDREDAKDLIAGTVNVFSE